VNVRKQPYKIVQAPPAGPTPAKKGGSSAAAAAGKAAPAQRTSAMRQASPKPSAAAAAAAGSAGAGAQQAAKRGASLAMSHASQKDREAARALLAFSAPAGEVSWLGSCVLCGWSCTACAALRCVVVARQAEATQWVLTVTPDAPLFHMWLRPRRVMAQQRLAPSPTRLRRRWPRQRTQQACQTRQRPQRTRTWERATAAVMMTRAA
jgi:anaerobic selenocysteine-containing dehydrogenase